MTLSEYLTQNSLSIAAFAARLGVNKSAVSRWATGARLPRRDMMNRINDATEGEVTANDFFESTAHPQEAA